MTVREQDETNCSRRAEGGPATPRTPTRTPTDELTVDDILAAASDDGQAADDTVPSSTRRSRSAPGTSSGSPRSSRTTASGSSGTSPAPASWPRRRCLQSLLPVLDDIDRARSTGTSTAPWRSVAEQLSSALGKHGLESFGMKGDPFDPQVHEAVAHMQMPDVDGPTCIDVMRSGYRLGDKLLRPALVAVAEPSDDVEAEAAADLARTSRRPRPRPKPRPKRRKRSRTKRPKPKRPKRSPQRTTPSRDRRCGGGRSGRARAKAEDKSKKKHVRGRGPVLHASGPGPAPAPRSAVKEASGGIPGMA